jgi:hypothetical protein
VPEYPHNVALPISPAKTLFFFDVLAKNIFLFPAKTPNIAEFWLKIKLHHGKISGPRGGNQNIE